MAVLLIDAFSVVILNLAPPPGSSFDYNTSWNSFDFDIHWKFICLWNFLAVFWIVILPCNTFIVALSDSTLDISVILSGSTFVLTLPGSALFAALHFNPFDCGTPLWYSSRQSF